MGAASSRVANIFAEGEYIRAHVRVSRTTLARLTLLWSGRAEGTFQPKPCGRAAGLRTCAYRDERLLRARPAAFFAPLRPAVFRDRDDDEADRDREDDDDRLALAVLREPLDALRPRLDVARFRPAVFRPPLLRPPADDDFVSPASARCLLTVRAAISSARSSPTPRASSESLTWSY